MSKKEDSRPNYYQDVKDFHEKFRLVVEDQPTIPSRRTVDLRISLIEEETAELLDALDWEDIVGVADAVADLIYVVLGTAISYGIAVDAIWRVIHDTNMKKVGGKEREDGKILKPEGWVPPDILGELRKQGW